MSRSPTSGGLAGRYRYDPYGQTTEDTTTVPNVIRFAGQYRDAQTGLDKMGVRDYEPVVARSISMNARDAPVSSVGPTLR